MQSLQENANSMSGIYKLRIRGYSDTIIPGGSSIAQDSPLDGATGTPNKGSRMDKNTGSSKLGNKKAVGKPANLEKIEHELSYLRRNSTGNLGIEMGDSKVLPRHVSVPTGSSDANKDGAELNCKFQKAENFSWKGNASMHQKISRFGSSGIEIGESKVLSCSPSVPTGSRQEVRKYTVASDLKKKVRTLQRTRPVAASEEIPEMARTVKLQIGKKPLSSTKLPNFKSQTTFRTQGKKIPASTKIAVEKGSSGLSKKKDAITISHSTRISVKRVSGKKLNNNSPGMVSQRNKQISLPGKTGKVIRKDDPNKVSHMNNLTSLARTKKMQPSHQSFPNKASQLRKSASLKRGKMELGSNRSVPKGTLYIRESKTKIQTIQISLENRKRVSPLDRHGPIRGKKPSPHLSPSSSLHSDGSSSRKHGNRKASLSSTSACESVNGDAIFSSSKKSGTTSPNQDIKAGRAAICSPKNLMFRRGKIIDYQSEKLSPRRLKFRPPKILENNGNGSDLVRGRSSRRFIAYGKSNAAKDETMRVNLRHQSRRDKKEAPILFNNVIEETATKLEETRRSKVQALVGAFETVISLQDPTSTPPIISR